MLPSPPPNSKKLPTRFPPIPLNPCPLPRPASAFFPRFGKILQDSTGFQTEQGGGSEVQPCKVMLLGMLVGYRAAAGAPISKKHDPVPTAKSTPAAPTARKSTCPTTPAPPHPAAPMTNKTHHFEMLTLFGYALTQSVLTFDVEIALWHGILEF